MTAQEIIKEIDKIVKEAELLEEKVNRLEMELDKYKWKPIDTFDGRMFSLMTTGIPDQTEMVKYKGEVPEWAAFWTEVPRIPRELVEQYRGT